MASSPASGFRRVRAMRAEEDAGRQISLSDRRPPQRRAACRVGAGAAACGSRSSHSSPASFQPWVRLFALATVSVLPVFAGVGAWQASWRRRSATTGSPRRTRLASPCAPRLHTSDVRWLRWATPLGWAERCGRSRSEALVLLSPATSRSASRVLAAGGPPPGHHKRPAAGASAPLGPSAPAAWLVGWAGSPSSGRPASAITPDLRRCRSSWRSSAEVCRHTQAGSGSRSSSSCWFPPFLHAGRVDPRRAKLTSVWRPARATGLLPAG
jgi:hypothetical protein